VEVEVLVDQVHPQQEVFLVILVVQVVVVVLLTVHPQDLVTSLEEAEHLVKDTLVELVHQLKMWFQLPLKMVDLLVVAVVQEELLKLLLHC
jgi:hypothetical protein